MLEVTWYTHEGKGGGGGNLMQYVFVHQLLIVQYHVKTEEGSEDGTVVISTDSGQHRRWSGGVSQARHRHYWY